MRLLVTNLEGGVSMSWVISFLAIGVVALGTSLDRRRQRERARLPRPEIDRWEEEGGAVPVDSGRTAAQTQADPVAI
jgi:hypothetical protein